MFSFFSLWAACHSSSSRRLWGMCICCPLLWQTHSSVVLSTNAALQMFWEANQPFVVGNTLPKPTFIQNEIYAKNMLFSFRYVGYFFRLGSGLFASCKGWRTARHRRQFRIAPVPVKARWHDRVRHRMSLMRTLTGAVNVGAVTYRVPQASTASSCRSLSRCVPARPARVCGIRGVLENTKEHIGHLTRWTMEYVGQLLQKEAAGWRFLKTENAEEYLHFVLKAELKRDLNDSCPLHWLSAQD